MAENTSFSGPLPNPLPINFTTLGNGYRITRSIWIASLAVLIYDYFLTLGDEIVYIWGGKPTRSRLLFYINRYWGIFNLTFDNIYLCLSDPPSALCLFFYNWYVYASVITHFCIGAILILRIYAMYNCSRRTLRLIVCLFMAEIATETVVGGYAVSKIRVMHLPGYPGCLPITIVSWIWAYWVPMFVFESCLFLLALAKMTQVACAKRGETPDLMIVLICDSLVYFGGVLAMIIANLVIWEAARRSLFESLLGAIYAVHSILGCRMLLNIRKTANKYNVDETAIFTTMQFRDRELAQVVEERTYDGQDDIGEELDGFGLENELCTASNGQLAAHDAK